MISWGIEVNCFAQISLMLLAKFRGSSQKPAIGLIPTTV